MRDARSAGLKFATVLFVFITAACQTDTFMTKPGGTVVDLFDDQSACKEAATSPNEQDANPGVLSPEVAAVVKATNLPEQSVEAATSPNEQDASSGVVSPDVAAVVKATNLPEQSVFDCMQARGWRQVISP